MSDTPSAPLAVLDLEHLAAMTGGDDALAIEVIDIFHHQADIWSRLLDPRLDTATWADAAHTLKGASLGIGALKLAAACERAETAGRRETQPSLTAASVLLNDIKDALGEAREATARATYDLTSAGRRSAS